MSDLHRLISFATTGVALAKVVFYRHKLEKTKRRPNVNMKLSTRGLPLCFISFKPENYFFVDSAPNSISYGKKLVVG